MAEIEYVRDHSLRQCVIDCRRCDGPASLTSAGCVKCVMEVLSGDPGIDEVILRGDMEVLYSSSVVKDVRGRAAILGRLRELCGAVGGDGRCQNCAVNPAVIYPQVEDAILTGNRGVVRHILDQLCESPGGPGCDTCLTMLRELLVRFLRSGGM